jgi:hypothetical protein
MVCIPLGPPRKVRRCTTPPSLRPSDPSKTTKTRCHRSGKECATRTQVPVELCAKPAQVRPHPTRPPLFRAPPRSQRPVVGVMDTTQLGALAPVRFSATATRDWKCGCPATMSEPRESKTRLSGAKGVCTRARSESAWCAGRAHRSGSRRASSTLRLPACRPARSRRRSRRGRTARLWCARAWRRRRPVSETVT